MLVERPFQREYASAQQRYYLRNQHTIGLQHAIENLSQFPTNEYGHHGVSANVQAWQPALVYRTRVGTTGSSPVSQTSTSQVSRGQTSNGCHKGKRLARHDHQDIKREVCAFGPKHAENARRFYQSKAAKPHLEEISVQACPYNYGPMRAPYKQTQVRGYFPGKRGSKMKTQQPLHPCKSSDRLVASERYQTVLKIANISPRPDKKQTIKPKTLFSFLGNEHQKEDHSATKKSNNFQDSEDERDLSNAPVFQILCEISKK